MTDQLSFEGLLASAQADNERAKYLRETAHLPATMDEGIPYFRELLAQHHAHMLSANVESVMDVRDAAHQLAVRLNDGDGGILADDDAAGRVLERLTASPEGTVPIWGQTGNFLIDVDGMRVRIELDGVFGIGATFNYWPGFSAHIVDHDKPFLSETGYRSFFDFGPPIVSGMTPDDYVRAAIRAYLVQERRGKRRSRAG